MRLAPLATDGLTHYILRSRPPRTPWPGATAGVRGGLDLGCRPGEPAVLLASRLVAAPARLPRFPLDTGFPIGNLPDVIALPTIKSSQTAPRLLAAALALTAAGCSLTYVQGPDHQHLDVEILRPINVNQPPGDTP